MTLTLKIPPQTPAEPVTEILHGVPVTDPYRWLEDQNSPRTREWLEAQTAYARAYLEAIPGRERIRRRVEELLSVEVVSEPWKVADRYFYLRRAPHQEQPVIMMREGRSGKETVLVDPAERGEGTAAAVSILSISGDGGLLAYSLRHGGEDSYAVEFFDVDRGKVLPDRLPRGFCRGLSFSSNREGFYYVHRAMGVSRPHYQAVQLHSFGKNCEEDREIFFAGDDQNLYLTMFGIADGSSLAYLLYYLNDPIILDIYLHELNRNTEPRRVIERSEGILAPVFTNNRLIVLTDREAPNGRVVAIDPEAASPNGWREIVPEKTSRIQDFAVIGGLVFVGYVEDGLRRVEIFDLSGQKRGALPCPATGTVRTLPAQAEGDTLFYKFTNFAYPPTILCYHTSTGKHEVWSCSPVPFDPSSIETHKVQYVSKDGTKVPMFLVRKRDHSEPHPQPTFLTGYGGFGASITPQFAAYATFLMESGCLFAVANLRGGSELGEDWHRAAKRRNRQNAIDDFVAAAEWLLQERLAAPGQIAIGGGSHAGLIVAAALTQRPDLFRAVISLGPLLDMIRYHLFDFARLWLDEYGSSEREEDFDSLRAYSPYHQVREGIAYPAVLLISGDADSRCNPMHARKMTAKLQTSSSSGHPILLDYRPTWGHVPAQPLSTRIEALTDRLAFICHELGVSV